MFECYNEIRKGNLEVKHMEELIKSIIDVGFAPVMCLLIYKVNCDKLESLEKIISNNTLVIQRLLDKLGVNVDDGK